APLAARDERGVHRNQRGRERAFAEQVLQEVGNAECGAPRVGIRLETEEMGDRQLPHEPGDAAEEDSGGDEHRRTARLRGEGGGHLLLCGGAPPPPPVPSPPSRLGIGRSDYPLSAAFQWQTPPPSVPSP